MCLTNYGASETVNLCSRYVEKSTKYLEQKYASYFREYNQLLLSNLRVCKFFPTFTKHFLFVYVICYLGEFFLQSDQTQIKSC